MCQEEVQIHAYQEFRKEPNIAHIWSLSWDLETGDFPWHRSQLVLIEFILIVKSSLDHSTPEETAFKINNRFGCFLLLSANMHKDSNCLIGMEIWLCNPRILRTRVTTPYLAYSRSDFSLLAHHSTSTGPTFKKRTIVFKSSISPDEYLLIHVASHYDKMNWNV